MSSAAVGLMGVVVTRIRGGDLPGEVRVVQAGMPHTFIAYAADPLPIGVRVLVINDRGSRRVDVEPWALGVSGTPGEPERP